jgi:hypothetical protein
MRDILVVVLYAVLAMYVLWTMYLAVMNLVRARDAGKLTRVAYCLGLPIFIVGLALDVALNWVVLSAILLEWPRETTMTARLRRHFQTPGTWRYAVALWFGVNLLDAFDPNGAHIK